MKIGIICSDDRMMQIAYKLEECPKYEIERITEHCDFMKLPMLDYLVLPVKGIDRFGYITIQGINIHVPSMFWQTQSSEMILFCSYEMEGLSHIKNKKYFYMQEESVIDSNAILTAEGVLHELISCTCHSIYSIRVDVIGYGHCGKAIYEMLKNLHVDVRIIRRDDDHKKRTIAFSKWESCGDVIINTSPKCEISEEMMQKWDNTPILLDIATPEQFDLERFQKYHITYKKIGNLPSLYSSITAGNIISDYVRRVIENEK